MLRRNKSYANKNLNLGFFWWPMYFSCGTVDFDFDFGAIQLSSHGDISWKA